MCIRLNSKYVILFSITQLGYQIQLCDLHDAPSARTLLLLTSCPDLYSIHLLKYFKKQEIIVTFVLAGHLQLARICFVNDFGIVAFVETFQSTGQELRSIWGSAVGHFDFSVKSLSFMPLCNAESLIA